MDKIEKKVYYNDSNNTKNIDDDLDDFDMKDTDNESDSHFEKFNHHVDRLWEIISDYSNKGLILDRLDPLFDKSKFVKFLFENSDIGQELVTMTKLSEDIKENIDDSPKIMVQEIQLKKD